ncbi:MAG: DNRLRE domain-containing protein [Methylotenera sp.]
MRLPHFKMAGFTLLPVVLAMSLIAAIAFLLNRDNGMNVNMIAKQMDSDRARYAAEAGLQAANAKVQTMSCTGGFPVIGTPVTNNNFGGASYSAYATTAAGNTTSLVSTGTYNGASVTLTRNNIYVYQTIPNTYTLQPDATTGMDTYVDSTITANYGVASTLKLSNDKNMLFKFDLTAFPAGSRPISAKFSIKQNGALLSSSNFYRMTSDWVEGTGASSPLDGATWATKNGSSAWATSGGDYHPAELNSTAVINSFGSWADFDATDLMASWLSGQYPNFGLIVKSNANNSPTFISSDSATVADRPKITFNYLVPCGATGPADPPPITELTLTPTADSFNDSGAPTANNGGATAIKTYYTPTRENRIVMQFNTSSIPTGSVIQSAKLRVYVSAVGSATVNTKSIWANAINESWAEGTGNNTNKSCPVATAGTSWSYKTNCTNWVSNLHPPFTPEAWTSETVMKTPRTAHVTVAVNNKIYAIGGQVATTGAASNAVEEYNPITKVWTTKSNTNFTARSHAAATVHNGKIYVLGGTTDGNNPVTKNEMYDPATDTWTNKKVLPIAKMYLAAAEANGLIYAIGGATSSTAAVNTLHAYDPVSDTWVAKANMGTKRAWPAAQSVNGKIYVFGGLSNISALTSTSSAEYYDPATDKWLARLAMTLTADSMASTVLGNKIYLISGYQNGVLSKGVRAYDTLSNTYKSLLNMPVAINQPAAVAINGKIYSSGGDDASSVLSNHYLYGPGIPTPVATAADETTSTSPLAAGFSSGWINFDLKPLVQEWVDGVRPNNGLVLYTEVADQFSINSKENSSNKAQLIVTY